MLQMLCFSEGRASVCINAVPGKHLVKAVHKSWLGVDVIFHVYCSPNYRTGSVFPSTALLERSTRTQSK